MNGTRHLKLLLADDDKPIANIYKTGLRRYFVNEEGSPLTELEGELFGEEKASGTSASVTVCSQGAKAVELAEDAMRCGEPFDVIILDIRMPPGISGIDAAEKIRSFDQGVPIIFVSGYSDVTITDLQERVPPSDLMCYLEKPIQLAQLADRIR
ncbi:MAG: response regulator, partial [Woeseiaceae bacterium]